MYAYTADFWCRYCQQDVEFIMVHSLSKLASPSSDLFAFLVTRPSLQLIKYVKRDLLMSLQPALGWSAPVSPRLNLRRDRLARPSAAGYSFSTHRTESSSQVRYQGRPRNKGPPRSQRATVTSANNH